MRTFLSEDRSGQMNPPVYRLGVDVGGSFTDLLLLRENDGQTWRSKIPSSPDDPSLSVIDGIDQLLSKTPEGACAQLRLVNHGTTVATNAILEHKGARVALIVTEGYKDILQTRRSQVPGNLASWITWPKPEPLAPLELTVEAPGRLATNGHEVRQFDEATFAERLKSVVTQAPDAFTISLMNSFANSAHEQTARKVVNSLSPTTPVSISSEVLPELSEYERTITTVVNSYVGPRVSRYMSKLLSSLDAKTKHLRILRSDGGLSSVSLASQLPVNHVLSGPAGGVSGVVSIVADRTKYKNLITLDMGGTSCDVSLIENGKPQIRHETEIGDLLLRVPSVDVRTVGAGGGSIARVPEVTKALRVGPDSAGARPGPACYGKGGLEATVTDANAVLGYLPKHLLGGSLALDMEAAKHAVQKVADKLGVGLYEAAEGILKISNETMFGALRHVTVERGFDPRNFSLAAFGGAGPLHANSLGKLLGSFPVIIPPSPGVLCAFGDVTTVPRHEVSKTHIRVLQQTEREDILDAYRRLLAEVQSLMSEDQGVPEDKQIFRYEADLRYSGQAINVPVEVDFKALSSNGLAGMRETFEAKHEKLFTFRLSSNVELVNLRIVAEEMKTNLPTKLQDRAKSLQPSRSAQVSTTKLTFEGQHFDEAPIWERLALKEGNSVSGPCIVTEMDSNTLVLPGYKADIDASENLLIWPLEEKPQPVPDANEELDTVTVDIFESALRNARYEMDSLVTRTAMSPAIREQQDEFNMIAEPSGKMIVGQFGSFIPQFLENWKGSVEPGDIFLTNDPYSVSGAVSHHNDWLILKPIFSETKMIAWTANFGHMTDVGGAVPGSLPCAASSVFEEGIQIPLTKIASQGVWNEGVLQVVYRNVRKPEWNRGDLRALVASCELAGQRMIELYKRFGVKIYFDTIHELLERNRKAVSSIIRTTMPDKPVYFEDWIDDDGQGIGPWKIACTMSKRNDRLSFDFSGTDVQSPSSINFLLSINMFKMFVGIYLLVVHDPSVVPNDGFQDLFDVYIPHGSLLNPVRPGALSCRTHMLGRIFDVLSALLGQESPQFMTAAGFSDSPHFMYSGYKQDGEWFQLYWIGFGGIPGRPIGDGPDGHCLWPGMKSIPNEFLELYYPLRIEVYETIADSGGAGLYRGGNGQRIFWHFLEDGEISLHDDRWLSKPWGVLQGQPGARSSKTLVRHSQNTENPPREALGSKQDHIKVSSGDVLEWVTWGGGGWGDPLMRDPACVALEVRRKLVSSEGAKRYGVVLHEDLSVDKSCTDVLREEMRIAREGEGQGDQVFNRGGTWDELKATCIQDTGLAAPRAPWEVPLRGPMTQLPYFDVWRSKQIA